MRTLKKSGVTTLRTIILFLFAFYHTTIQAQCMIPSGNPNSLLPVTNNYIVRDYGDHLVGHVPTSIHKMAASNGTYYLAGDFTTLTPNFGPALVVDSGTSTIKTPQQWRINGTVLTAIPDGQGGFYIGGNFTRIGDSTRKYIAQIKANGQPTAWNPRADSTVKMLQLRKDTLYISGDFSTIFSRKRSAMAIYSLKGDSLVNSRIYSFSSINSFLLKNDTLIVGGKGRNPIFDDPNMSAFRISDSMYLTYWSLHYEEYGEIDLLRFNADSSIIVYRSDNFGHTIKAFTTQTGVLLYKNKLMVYWPYDYAYGKCFSLKLVGNKMYAAGYFETVHGPGGMVTRKGFFSFDARTGIPTSDELQIDGYPTFVEEKNGKLFISGNFETVNSVPRLKTVKGDTLFLLAVNEPGANCELFNTNLYLYRLSNGQQLTAPRVGVQINDFAIEGDDMYITYDDQLRKFQLPNMTKVGLWGMQYNTGYAPVQLILKDNTIHTIGDNRFVLPCSNNIIRISGYTRHDKATGSQLANYSYRDTGAFGSNLVTFNHGLLVNNKMYIQGSFRKLQGKERKNLVCIDINTGDITDWQPTTLPVSSFPLIWNSDLKLHNGQVWFGSAAFEGDDLNGPGFGALDTITGQLMHRAIIPGYKSVGSDIYYKANYFNDFIFSDKNLIAVGSFDYVNNMPAVSIASFSLAPGISSPITPTTLYGTDTIYAITNAINFILHHQIPSLIPITGYIQELAFPSPTMGATQCRLVQQLVQPMAIL